MEGFLRYQFGGLMFGGLIFGGAYIWRDVFSEFYGMFKKPDRIVYES